MILNSFESLIKECQTVSMVQGIIVDSSDPLQKSRVRVSIPGMTDKIKKEHLPWYPIITKVTNSQTEVPPEGTRVVLYYIDIYNALVKGSIVSITSR